MRTSRVANGAQQLIETVFFDQTTMRPVTRTERLTSGPPTALATPSQQLQQPLADEAIHLVELARGVARAKVAAPSAQHRVEFPDDLADVGHARPIARTGEVADAGADGVHRLRG